MIHPRTLMATLGTATAALGACAPAAEVPEERGQAPVYQGAPTILLLDEGLVSVTVAVSSVGDVAEVEAYGRCVAARYALDQGYGFARQVRTIVKKEGRMRYGDAVYLLTSTLPAGEGAADTATTVADCAALGIPTE